MEAAEIFDRVVKKYPEAIGENGLPFQPLAQLKWLQLSAAAPDIAGTNPVSVESLYSNIVYHPTSLTPELLKQAELLPAGTSHEDSQIRLGRRVKWQLLWQIHAAARQLYAAAREHFFARANPAPPAFPLLSTGANDGNQTAGDETLRLERGGTVTNISFPRLFWFATSNLLYVPKAPGRGTEGAQNIYQGYVVMETHAAGSNSSSNAISTVTRWVAGTARWTGTGWPSGLMTMRPTIGLSAAANPIWASASRNWRPAKNTFPIISASASKWRDGKSGR